MIESGGGQPTVIAPFYKGLVNIGPQNLEHASLFTGWNYETNSKVEPEAYLGLVRDNRRTEPALTQDIARATAAALAGAEINRNGGDARLVSVEGCPQQIGNRALSGGEIIQGIWRQVVPKELMAALPEPTIRLVSGCAIEEVRTVLKELRAIEGWDLVGVTHDYHIGRVDKMLHEEMLTGESARVLSPREVVRDFRADQPYERFAADLVKAGEPDTEIVAKERKWEKLVYGPLHSISRFLEKRFGGNFEIWMANRARKKPKQLPT